MFKKSSNIPPKQAGDGQRNMAPLYSGNQAKDLKPLVVTNANAKNSRLITK